MAWNEPGGSGNKDPWGGGGKDQGPPDLDEVVKKLQTKFGSIFGGRGGGTAGSAGGGNAGSIGIGLIILIVLAIWAISGVYIVDEGKRGVIRQFGAYSKTTQPGPHWYPRFIQTKVIVDVLTIRDATIGYRAGTSSRQAVTSVTRESLMLTRDENIVDINLAVQYKVSSAADYLFNVKNPELTLRDATESALREVIGRSDMTFILTRGRAEISSQAKVLIQEILDRYKAGLLITSVNMQYAQPPQQVKAAFDDAVKAREDNERLKDEAEAYANDILPRASGKAARLVQESNGYREKVIAEAKGETSRFLQVLAVYKKAPTVTRKRLYLDAIESVMANTSKVMIDIKGGNNIMYLPLDRLLGGSGESMFSPQVTESTPARTTIDQRSRGNLRSRGER